MRDASATVNLDRARYDVERCRLADRELCQLKAGNRAVAGAERIDVRAQAAEELHEQIAERRVFLRVEGEMLAVSEAASKPAS